VSVPFKNGPRSRARVLLADDNPLVAAEMRQLLELSFDVVGVVQSGEELETACEALAPEVVVTDIAMPGQGGLTAVRHIQERHPGIRVVLLTVIDAQPMVRLGLSMGVQGYVVKGDAGDELVPAVEAALQGRRYISGTALASQP
jgi:DNA-binding NarL/FixJ family response regulator